MLVVDEDYIAISILRLIEVEKSVVEGAGATALAALIQGLCPELEGELRRREEGCVWVRACVRSYTLVLRTTIPSTIRPLSLLISPPPPRKESGGGALWRQHRYDHLRSLPRTRTCGR